MGLSLHCWLRAHHRPACGAVGSEGGGGTGADCGTAALLSMRSHREGPIAGVFRYERKDCLAKRRVCRCVCLDWVHVR
jgi:hypothetical protein